MSGGEEYLDCPACGEPCRTLLGYGPTAEYPYTHWFDGDWATCEYGADVMVDADGERAFLKEVE